MTHDTQIRSAQAADLPSIEAILSLAFPTDLEARLARLLISHHKDIVSLVGTFQGQLAGHILFSPVMCCQSPSVSPGLGLAPLAVIPDFQRQGVGTALVRAGLEECRRIDTAWVAVLGEPAYYRRFGFAPASRYQLTGEFGGDDAFQILLLDALRRPPPGSHIRYAPEFQELCG